MLGAVGCFSISFAIIKWPRTPGSVIAWWRLLGSSVLWWLVLAARRRRTGRPLPTRAAWRLMAIPAVLFGFHISILFTAVTRTSVAHSEFINSMSPFLTLPIGFVLFAERPNWPALRWGGLSLVGIAIVLSTGPDQGVATVEGDLLVVLALAFSVSFLSGSKWARTHGVETFESMAIMMPVALVSATPVALILAGDEIWPRTAETWIAIAVLSVLTGMAGHGLLYFAHRSVPIATISTIQVSQPALAVFWAWLILGERISPTQVPGMALVIVGLACVLWFSNRRPGQVAGDTLVLGPPVPPAPGRPTP